MGKYRKPIGFIFGKLAELCVGHLNDIHLNYASGCGNPNPGRPRLCYTVILQKHIQLTRFSSSPAVCGVKVAGGSVRGAEPAQDGEAADNDSLAPGSRFKLGNILDDGQHGPSSKVHSRSLGHVLKRVLARYHIRLHGGGGCQPSRISRPRPGSWARSRATNSGCANGHGSLVDAQALACWPKGSTLCSQTADTGATRTLARL